MLVIVTAHAEDQRLEPLLASPRPRQLRRPTSCSAARLNRAIVTVVVGVARHRARRRRHPRPASSSFLIIARRRVPADRRDHGRRVLRASHAGARARRHPRASGTLPATAPRWVPATLVIWLGRRAWSATSSSWGIAVAQLARRSRSCSTSSPASSAWCAASAVDRRTDAPTAAREPEPVQPVPAHSTERSPCASASTSAAPTPTPSSWTATRVLAAVKAATTAGRHERHRQPRCDALRAEHRASTPADVAAVMIGTTHFINALVEARRLAPTAALRLGLPATRALPPMVDWPDRLRRRRSAAARYLCARRPRVRRPPDLPARPRRAARRRRGHGRARRSARSRSRRCSRPVNAEFEMRAAEIVARGARPASPISLSHEIGRIGLLERENATIINAACASWPAEIVDGARPRDRRRTGIERAALPQPERRHADGRRLRAPLPGRHLRLRADELDARRGVPVRARRLRGRRRRRHHHRRRHAAQRLPARGHRPRSTIGGVRTNFRMPDVLSHRHRRRQPRPRRDRRRDGRPGLRRLRADRARRSSSAATR